MSDTGLNPNEPLVLSGRMVMSAGGDGFRAFNAVLSLTETAIAEPEQFNRPKPMTPEQREKRIQQVQLENQTWTEAQVIFFVDTEIRQAEKRAQSKGRRASDPPPAKKPGQGWSRPGR